MTDVSHETESYTATVQAQIEQVRAGRRKLVRHGGKLCSGCYDEEPMDGQRYGKRCHAAYEAKRRQDQAAELKRLRALAQAQEGASHG